MSVLYYPPTINGLQKTLDAQLDEGHTTAMTLNNVTGVQNKPGIVVINRVDGDGNEKAAALREFVAYTGTSGNTLTGLTRAKGGSTDQDHAVGSVVEFVPDVNVWQSIIDFLADHANESDTGDGSIKVANNTAYSSRNQADSANVALIKLNTSDQVAIGANALRPARFVVVSAPGALHYDSGVGAAKTTYTDVDVSSVVSTRAFAVAYRFYGIQNNGTDRWVHVKKNGSTDAAQNRSVHKLYGSGVGWGYDGIVEIDSNKIFEYKQDSAGGTDNACQYTFTIVGYWEYLD